VYIEQRSRGKKIMKVLLVNGSPYEKGCTYTALKEVSETLNHEGIGAEIWHSS
jgi:multimeric flavodoxin WrbA